MIAFIKQKWLAMPHHDQRIYTALGAVVAVLLIYALLWLPSQQARSRLETVIQQKRSQLAKMQMQVEQIKALQGGIKLSHRNQQGLQEAIETSAKLHNIRGNIQQLVANADGSIEMRLPAVDFNVWIAWMAALQSEHHVRIAACHIARIKNGVTVEATLVAE